MLLWASQAAEEVVLVLYPKSGHMRTAFVLMKLEMLAQACLEAPPSTLGDPSLVLAGLVFLVALLLKEADNLDDNHDGGSVDGRRVCQAAGVLALSTSQGSAGPSVGTGVLQEVVAMADGVMEGPGVGKPDESRELHGTASSGMCRLDSARLPMCQCTLSAMRQQLCVCRSECCHQIANVTTMKNDSSN
ncbi:hypothetical protein TREES_T100013040 [Tupaia chinensis]|uniref:Uncharacterized protein n=1 Tax=Tupaia chinensis TaxID=246437 RepID=L9L4X7_TUPCH|nr:hypothetical protein TREES_T100013040 [Tupaia chinensis]